MSTQTSTPALYLERERQQAVAAETTPYLVREYARLRVNAATQTDWLTSLKHQWLCAVVDELRSRGVLD